MIDLAPRRVVVSYHFSRIDFSEGSRKIGCLQ
jgi:hypothetical protein